MRDLSKLSIIELAVLISESLKKEGLQTTLSGGACAEIYSAKKYVTGDLDFVVNFIWPENRETIKRVMSGLGFEKNGRIYINESVAYSVEFPPGPLSIGDDYKIKPVELKLKTGRLSLLSPTDSAKDRLTGYFYGNDAQCLEQAVMICRKNNVEMANIRKWAKKEGQQKKYKEFENRLKEPDKKGPGKARGRTEKQRTTPAGITTAACTAFIAVFGMLLLSTPFLAQSFPPLPQGNAGIASRYPGDAGIALDSSVIFADDFEGYTSAAGLPARWNGGVYHDVGIATAAGKVFAGKQAVEFYLPQQSAEWSNTVARDLPKSQELDVLFLRYYTKFDALFDVSGSCHNGGGMSAHYFINGQATPGVPANGYNKFLAEFESWRGTVADTSPGLLNVYVYQPEQRSQWGDHFFPNGEVMPNTSIPGNFGGGFVSRPNLRCDPGKWYCCELMVKANTVGSRDGRIACWLDGVLIADFTNLRLRDADSLKINRFNLSLHAGSNTTRETWKWYDNVVAAKSYIGPMSLPGSTMVKTNRLSGQDNPSVSGTTISFGLDKPSPVAVAIYTARGVIIRSFVNRTFSIGNYSVHWDGRDGSGSLVARGMYPARVLIANKAWTGKVVFVK